MQAKGPLLVIAAVTSLGIASGCGSTASHTANSSLSKESGLGGPAPARLLGMFRTKIGHREVSRAPKPDELPIGVWTLVITNNGGANHNRALGVGPGDTDRVTYRFGVSGNRLVIRCDNDQDLPSAGTQTYTWSIREAMLVLKPASPACRHGDPNNSLVLSSHPWVRQRG
jgi:hypothetical protein